MSSGNLTLLSAVHWGLGESGVLWGPACGDMTMGQEEPLEEEMATHYSILARRIPWTKEPGGPQSVELQSQT